LAQSRIPFGHLVALLTLVAWIDHLDCPPPVLEVEAAEAEHAEADETA